MRAWVVSKWLDYGMKHRRSEVRLQVAIEIFLFSTGSRPALGPTPPHVHWVTGFFHPSGAGGRSYEADHALKQTLRKHEAPSAFLLTLQWHTAQLMQKNITLWLRGSRYEMTAFILVREVSFVRSDLVNELITHPRGHANVYNFRINQFWMGIFRRAQPVKEEEEL